MLGDTLLTAKLRIPTLREDYVARPRLVECLQSGLSRKVTIISSPAGFGKTTILCEWFKEKKNLTAWLSLDESDNDHGRFIMYVMAALRTLDIGMDEHIHAIVQAAEQGISLEPQMSVLLNKIALLPVSTSPIVLVLDDYNVIHNQQIHASMTFALDYLPNNVHIVIATRSEPPLPLSRLRSKHHLNEIRASDLRFTREEVHTFFNQFTRLRLSTDHINALDDRTEGWIAGLQLTIMAMNARSDLDQFVREFTGSHRYILDYLADEVFSRQPEEVCNFLLKTSILERMTPELCDAVTGQGNGKEMLSRLERENLFIVPMDIQQRWYRYHRLFADLLQNRAEQFTPKDRFNLNRKAALWYDEHDFPYDAINHALKSNDYDMAIAMMVKSTPTLAMRSEIRTLFTWLNSLPRDIRQSNPRIPLMFAWAHFFMVDFDAVQPYLLETLRIIGLDSSAMENWPTDSSMLASELLAQIYALRTFVTVNLGNPQKAIQIAQQVLKNLPMKERLSRFAVLAALGDAYRDADDFASASQTYSEALAISEVIDQYAASMTMRMDLARLRVKMGQLRHAEAICREVINWGSGRFHPLFPLVQAYSLLGDILRERGEFDAAEQIISSSIRQCELAGYQRYLVFSLISLARLKFAQGDSNNGDYFLESAQKNAFLSGSESLQDWVNQFRVRLKKPESDQWIIENMISINDLGNFQKEDKYLTLIRYQINKMRQIRSGDYYLVNRLLKNLLNSAEKSSRNGSVIEIKILLAQTHLLQGHIDKALHIFKQALALAEPEAYFRIFVDEGELIAELLKLAQEKNIFPEYAGHLLAVIDSGKPAVRNLPEALTEREFQVMLLLAKGLSNQEIADNLVISLSTTKTHITRIYGKLSVSSRTQAVIRARELKLL